jgi:hypothetical protein
MATDHTPGEYLTLYNQGPIADPFLVRAIEEHLLICHECQDQFAALREELIPDAPPGDFEALLRKIQERK